jgi:hypothetical protein
VNVTIERVCNDFDVRTGGEAYRLVILLPNGKLIEPSIQKEEFDAVIEAVAIYKATVGEEIPEETQRPQKVAVARRSDLVQTALPVPPPAPSPVEEEEENTAFGGAKVFGGDVEAPSPARSAGKILGVSADDYGNPVVQREGAMDHQEILGYGAQDEDGAPSI